MVTLRSDELPLYSYANGEGIRSRSGDRPLTEAEFRRLAEWLVPQRDGLFDLGPSQCWHVQRPPND